jgi:hypothetical protein
MPEFVLGHTQQWLDHFTSKGHDAHPLAAGVEGAMHDIGDGLIAKVWRERRAAERASRARLEHAALHLSRAAATPASAGRE